MTDRKRIPGVVDEKADPIGISESSQASRSSVNEPVRDPGLVREPAEPVSDSEPEQPLENEVPRVFIESSPWKIVFVLVVSAGIIWLLVEAAISLIAVYNYSIYFGIPAIIFALLVLISIGWAGHREYVALNSIDRLEERDEEIKSALETNDQGVLGIPLIRYSRISIKGSQILSGNIELQLRTVIRLLIHSTNLKIL
jgi:hypothetical protein